MKQMIAKNRKEAIEFAEGGNGNTQRAAYWMQGKIINRAEVIPGQKEAAITENVGGYWWDAKTTIAQKFERNPISSAKKNRRHKMKNQNAVALGKIGRSKNTEAQAEASKENGKKGGRPKGYTQKEIADIYDRSGLWSPRSRRTVIIANAVSHYDDILSDPYETKTTNRKNTIRAAWESLNEDPSQFDLSDNQEELFAKGQLII